MNNTVSETRGRGDGQVFAVDVSRPIPDSQVLKVEPALPGLELSARINAVLGRLRDSRGNYPTCFVVRQGALTVLHSTPHPTPYPLSRHHHQPCTLLGFGLKSPPCRVDQ